MPLHDSTTAICLFRPVSAEQEAEEARRRDLELYTITPPDTPTTSSLKTNPTTPIPHARPAGSCINNTAAATNNFSQSPSFGSCQRDFSRKTVAGPNVASKDNILESIAQVNQGDQYQQRICELFQTLLDPAGPVPLPLGSAIAHHLGASSGETDAIQDVSAVTVHARHGSLDDGWASSVQTTSQATTSGATTPFQPSFDGTTSRMSPDIAALNDYFAKLSLTMGQRGLGRPQVENATRAAENKPGLADKSLLDVVGVPPNTDNTSTIATLDGGGAAQATPSQIESVTTLRWIPTYHASLFRPAFNPTRAIVSKAAPANRHATRPARTPERLLGLSGILPGHVSG